MGVMRFLIRPSERGALWSELHKAYLGGIDGRVYPTTVEIDGDLLICRRETSDSARLHVAYPVPGFGRPMLCTSALREQEEPYLLSVELARGKLGLIRDQFATWLQIGMDAPDDADGLLRGSHASLCRAVCSQTDPAEAIDVADQALIRICETAEQLAEAYIRQRLAIRRRRSSHLPVLLSCPLGWLRPGAPWEKPIAAAFTAAAVSIGWRSVELQQGEYDWTLADEQIAFAERSRLVPIGGPVIDFGRSGLPDWLWQWGHDYYALQCFVSDFVETAITRYAGRVRLWEIVAQANAGGALQLDEEQRLMLAARAVEVARQVDDELRLSLRVTQPWGEYQTEGNYRLSPLQFVDALVRSGVGLTGVTLEIAVGYDPGGSAYRDRLELSRLIDLWSALGLSLSVSLAFPSQVRRSEAAETGAEITDPCWKAPWSEPAQADWLAEILPLLMAKPSVVGIEWAHFSDAVPHRFPNAGLLRSDGSAKPALERLTRFRQSYWQRGRDAS